MLKNWNNFSIRIEDLKPYMVEFEEDGIIKPNINLFDCVIGGNNYWSIIIIIDGKCIFFANKGI